MRKRKIIKIDEKEVTVKELTVQDMLDIFQNVKESEGDILSFRNIIEKHIDKAVDLPIESFKTMTPSEIKEIWDAFREVNSVFFEMAASMGMHSMLVEMRKSFIKDWSNAVLSSSKQGIPTSLNTAHPSLS